MSKIYIAGAHSRGTTIGHYLTYLDSSIEILAYLYDNDEDNPESINGIPVIKINKESKLEVECPVYIGMRGVNFDSVSNTLRECGIKKIIPVDMALDTDIRNRFLEKYYASIGRRYNKINDFEALNGKVDLHTVNIYVATSAFDKPLIDSYTMKTYEKFIQVGCSLTDTIMKTDFYDNEGENISELNRQFCELTGLYWIWKHAREDIVGLVHYRRHFLLPDNWIERMLGNDIDVILPVPLFVEPSIEGNYLKRHLPCNWNNMLKHLGNEGRTFFTQTSLYNPCNMFIMKKEILKELCEWMFPILFAVIKEGKTVEDAYQNRYPGFLSERLITYFFEKNRDKYKVVFADKNFLK